MKINAHTEAGTIRAAQDLAKILQGPDLLCLHGNLGAGKTVFARALIRMLTGNPALDVPSPTFTLLQTYDTPRGPLSHYDLYRLSSPEDIYELGWEESLAAGITIVEWPNRLGPQMPVRRLDIHLTNAENNPDARIIEIIRTG